MRCQTRHLLYAITGFALVLGLSAFSPRLGGVLALFSLSALVTIAVPMLTEVVAGAVKHRSLTGGINSLSAGLFYWVVGFGIAVGVGALKFWWEFGFLRIG